GAPHRPLRRPLRRTRRPVDYRRSSSHSTDSSRRAATRLRDGRASGRAGDRARHGLRCTGGGLQLFSQLSHDRPVLLLDHRVDQATAASTSQRAGAPARAVETRPYAWLSSCLLSLHARVGSPALRVRSRCRPCGPSRRGHARTEGPTARTSRASAPASRFRRHVERSRVPAAIEATGAIRPTSHTGARWDETATVVMTRSTLHAARATDGCAVHRRGQAARVLVGVKTRRVGPTPWGLTVLTPTARAHGSALIGERLELIRLAGDGSLVPTATH